MRSCQVWGRSQQGYGQILEQKLDKSQAVDFRSWISKFLFSVLTFSLTQTPAHVDSTIVITGLSRGSTSRWRSLGVLDQWLQLTLSVGVLSYSTRAVWACSSSPFRVCKVEQIHLHFVGGGALCIIAYIPHIDCCVHQIPIHCMSHGSNGQIIRH